MARLTYESFLERAETPQEGWELLATEGMIPDSWLDDPRRLFPCERVVYARDDGSVNPIFGTRRVSQPCPVCAGRGSLPHPKTLRNIWAFAQIQDHVVRAEALVLESYQQLREFGFDLTQPRTISWVATDARPAEDHYILRAYETSSVVLSGIPLRPEWLLRFDGFLMMRDRATQDPAILDPLKRRVEALWELVTKTCALYPYLFTPERAVLRWNQPTI